MAQFEFSEELGQSAPSGGQVPVPLAPPRMDFAPDIASVGTLPGEVGAVPASAAPALDFADDLAAQEGGNGQHGGAAEPPTSAFGFAEIAPAPQPEPAYRMEAMTEPEPAPPPAAARPVPSAAPAAPSGIGGRRPGIFAALSEVGGETPAAQPAARSAPAGSPADGAPPGKRPAIFNMLSGDAPIGRGGNGRGDAALEIEAPAVEPGPAPMVAEGPVGEIPMSPGGNAPPPGGGGDAGGGNNGGGNGDGGPGGAPPGGASGGGAPPGGGTGGPTAPAGARIGDKLVEMGLISADQLQVALYERKRTNKLLGTLLVELGFITEAALSSVLASASGFERFDPTVTVAEPELFKRIPKEVAQRYRVFPVSIEGSSLRLAMADIYDVVALDQMHRYVPPGCEIIPLVSSEADVLAAIDQYYGYEFSIDGILRELETGKHDTSTTALTGAGDTYVHPLVRLVNAVMLDAVRQGASDVHFEPESTFLRLRYRVDGVMQQVRTFAKDHWPAISHRLKIVSGMNIADKLNPQDGRFGFNVGTKRIDFRVAAMPTSHGENIVIRILDRSRAMLSLDDLGFSDENHKLLLRLLKRPEGIIIVTGPTGSGKTTTLYAVLNFVSSLERNIMTLEDPIEYELPLIRQAAVRDGTGMNFSDGVRAMLRQDPDIIFIGEVRDQPTATMALRAAMTGHQVYTTLHTNDAAGALPRLHDLGLEHSLLAGNIIGILAQRLVRKVCPTCAIRRPATAEECHIFGVDPAHPPTIAEAVGCDECRRTGYRGRIAVHELLPINAELDEMILSGASLAQVREAAKAHGYIPIADDGIAKVLTGVTTLDAVMRTVDLTDRL